MREMAEKKGVTVDLIAPPFLASISVDRDRHGAIMLGESPERDRDIEQLQTLIRNWFSQDVNFEDYEDHHFRRLDAKPGITGLWQVSGRSEMLDFEDVIYLDRQYIEQWSFWLDVSILFRTIPAVLRRTGAF